MTAAKAELHFTTPPAPPAANSWPGRPTIVVHDTEYLCCGHGVPCRLRVTFDQRLEDGGFDLPAGSVKAWLVHVDDRVQELDSRWPEVVDIARAIRHTRI
jgi:hypothetical protein